MTSCAHYKVISVSERCFCAGYVGISFLKCCVSVRAKLLLCPLEQNHYPSPDKVWERTRMFPVYFIEFSPAPPWEPKFFFFAFEEWMWGVNGTGVDGPVGVRMSGHGRGDVNRWSKIRSSPLVRVVADGGSKNEMMPAFFVQSGASSALDGPLETSVGPMW